MTTTPSLGRLALWILPVVLVVGAFFAAIPWLKAIDETMVTLITMAASVFVMSYANYLSFRAQRRLDEVQRAGGGFAAQWGAPAGQAAFVVLLLLPPVQDLVISVVSKFAGDPGISVDRTVIVFTMMLGFCTVVLLQSIGMLVVNALWWTGKR